MLESYVKKILSAKVYDLAQETPLTLANALSKRLGCEVMLKREDLQSIFSFKLRGAYNKIANLNSDERARGVITASAGNHAQGVSVAANKLNVNATVVMGMNTPSIKIDAVKNHGTKVILHGDSYDEAAEFAYVKSQEEGSIYVHPYDDPLVIAGQGTVGLEIASQHPADIDAIFVPVGGGGLIAGIAAYFKYLRPKTKIIGVEAEGSACLYEAKRTGKRIKLDKETLDLFADGVSVSQVGKESFKVAKDHVDLVIKVSTDEICAAIKDVFEDTRCVSEPAGALAIAGMKRYLAQATGIESAVAIVSGANVNFDRLRHISERAELGEEREAILAAKIDERPGSFLRFCKALGRRAITEFNYRFADAGSAHIYVGLGVESQADREAVVASLQEKNYSILDMTENEAAKLHVRHMVGGRSPQGVDELLYRFEFPERPGALLQFLTGLGQHWNISLFHYRNHGSAWGRVLVGFAASKKDQPALDKYLKDIGYRFWLEQDNPAYKMFLQ